jgi:hypothetical protein
MAEAGADKLGVGRAGVRGWAEGWIASGALWAVAVPGIVAARPTASASAATCRCVNGARGKDVRFVWNTPVIFLRR